MYKMNQLSAFKVSLLLLIGVLCCISSLHAATFRVIALSQVAGVSTLEFQGERGVEVVLISTSGFSERMKIPVNGAIDFYKKMPAEDVIQEPDLSVRLLADSEDVILLLRADRSQGTYSSITLSDSVSEFPLGAVRVLNFAEKSIFAKFGAERVLVEPGESQVVELTSKKDTPFNGGVKFAAEFDGYGKVFSSSSWYLLPTMKIFCVVYADEAGMPRIRRIRLT